MSTGLHARRATGLTRAERGESFTRIESVARLSREKRVAYKAERSSAVRFFSLDRRKVFQSGGKLHQRGRGINFLFQIFILVLIVCYGAEVADEYVSTERSAPRALLFVSRPEPAPVDCSLVTERRAARRLRVGCGATSLHNCATTQVINRSAAACCLSWITS